jgi:hypothetical protein
VERRQERVVSEVQPVLKDQGDCGCGCGRFGTFRVKAWKNGVRCVRACKSCNNCRGKRSRSAGDAGAAKVRRFLNASGVATRHEEGWGGALRIECKQGAQVGPVLTRYLEAKQQSEAHRAIGDNRPFVFAAIPAKGPRLYVIEEDELAQVVAAVADNWGLTA